MTTNQPLSEKIRKSFCDTCNKEVINLVRVEDVKQAIQKTLKELKEKLDMDCYDIKGFHMTKNQIIDTTFKKYIGEKLL